MENLLFLGVPLLKHIRVLENLIFIYIGRPNRALTNDIIKLTTVKTLNIGTPRLTTVVVLNMKQFNFTMQ